MPVIEGNGAQLYYEDHGSGQPIVFLHGATAGLRYFEPQLTGLSPDYRAIAFDFRGHGRSQKTQLGHTMAQYARDLRAVLEELDLDDVVIVGWSMGASVSWEYVDRFGTGWVQGLVDVDMEPSPMRREGYDHGSYDRADLAAAYAAVQSDPIGLVERRHPNLLSAPPSRALENLLIDEGTRTPPSVQAAMLVELPEVDHRDVLRAIDIPMLVCAGMDETWRSVAAVEAVADLVPDARVERFEESGHCPTVEEPERFNRVLADFVDTLA